MFVINQTKTDSRPKNLDGGIFLLVVTGLRYYTARLGRWASRDRLHEEGGWNLYGFCSNDSLSTFDSLGNLSFTFSGCTQDQQSAMNSIAESIERSVKAAYEQIYENPETDRTRGLMTRWYGSDQANLSALDENVNRVGHKLFLLTEAMRTLVIPIRCECNCGGREGWVRRVPVLWFISGDIHLCNSIFPTADSPSVVSLATTLIHEMTHKYSVTEDYGYFLRHNVGGPDDYLTPTGATAHFDIHQLFENADTYAEMVMEEFYGK